MPTKIDDCQKSDKKRMLALFTADERIEDLSLDFAYKDERRCVASKRALLTAQGDVLEMRGAVMSWISKVCESMHWQSNTRVWFSRIKTLLQLSGK